MQRLKEVLNLGEYSLEFWVGVSYLVLQTLTLFQTKTSYFLIPFFRPGPLNPNSFSDDL